MPTFAGRTNCGTIAVVSIMIIVNSSPLRGAERMWYQGYKSFTSGSGYGHMAERDEVMSQIFFHQDRHKDCRFNLLQDW